MYLSPDVEPENRGLKHFPEFRRISPVGGSWGGDFCQISQKKLPKSGVSPIGEFHSSGNFFLLRSPQLPAAARFRKAAQT